MQQDRQSYRQTVEPQRVGIGYTTRPEATRIDERRLRHTTIYRVLTWLGMQTAALTAGRQLLLDQKLPDTPSPPRRHVAHIAEFIHDTPNSLWQQASHLAEVSASTTP